MTIASKKFPRISSRVQTQSLDKNHYPDVGDNVHANVCSWLDVNCGQSEDKWFIPGTCTQGHRYAKVIYCGKEWCPVCGTKGSAAHNRRYVRWLSKIRQFDTMRYLVFTIPENIRYKYRTKESLKELGRSVQLIMIKNGFKRGLRRWHWFGDKSTKWNPHLNVLVEGSYIKKSILQDIKTEWANILGTDLENVHTTYKNTPSDMCGSLHYITRATFLDYDWDLDMALELRNFRNMVVWGRDWKQEPKWDFDKTERLTDTGEVLDVYSIDKLMEHSCPHCGANITWAKALPGRLLDLTDNVDLGAGFKYILDRDKPDSMSESVKERLQTLHLLKVAYSLGAIPADRQTEKRGYIKYNPLLPGGKELFYTEN